MLNEKLIVIQFIEKPDTQIRPVPTTASRNNAHSNSQQLINEDSLVQLVMQTITQYIKANLSASKQHLVMLGQRPAASVNLQLNRVVSSNVD